MYMLACIYIGDKECTKLGGHNCGLKRHKYPQLRVWFGNLKLVIEVIERPGMLSTLLSETTKSTVMGHVLRTP